MADEAGLSSIARHRIVSDPQSLIHLFSPTTPPPRLDPALTQPDRRALWSEDSVHRAKNLAQLASALVHVRPRSADPSYLDMMAANAASLSDAYAELAQAPADDVLVPCAQIMTRIVRGLIALFGERPKPIRLQCAIAELDLSRERRRALVLIASELVVNTLKYAFPERSGTITVSLAVAGPDAQLVVQDDGVGLGPAARPGTGSRILDELSVLLVAPVERGDAAGGGLRIALRFPVSVATR